MLKSYILSLNVFLGLLTRRDMESDYFIRFFIERYVSGRLTFLRYRIFVLHFIAEIWYQACVSL